MSDAELVTCPDCGMSWFTRRLCEHCAFRPEPDPDCEVCGGRVNYGLTAAHACPEPFPYETALVMSSSRVIVNQRVAARVRLGLRAGPG